MSTPFRERNPVIIGAVSLAVMAAFILGAFKADSLPLIGGGTTYYAAFSEAGGLKANDEVRVAGVRVGKVKAVELEGDHVRVEFKVDKSAKFGSETGAAIKVKTLLGAMFVALEPAGRGQMKEKAEIPTSRTTSPYDVVEAFSGLAERSEAINTKRLADLAEHAGRPDEDDSEELQGRPLRAVGPLRERREARRPAELPAAQHQEGLEGARRPQRRPDHVDAQR